MAKTLGSAPAAGSTFAGKGEIKSTANHNTVRNEQLEFENEEQKKSLETLEQRVIQEPEQGETLLEMQERQRLEEELQTEEEKTLESEDILVAEMEHVDDKSVSTENDKEKSFSNDFDYFKQQEEEYEVNKSKQNLEQVNMENEPEQEDEHEPKHEVFNEAEYPTYERQQTVNVKSRDVRVKDYSDYNKAVEEQYFADKADKYDTLVGAASEVIDEAQCDSMKKENEVSIEETSRAVNVKPGDTQQGKKVEGNQAITETAGQIEAESKETETHDQPQAQRQSEKMSVESQQMNVANKQQPRSQQIYEQMMEKFERDNEQWTKQQENAPSFEHVPKSMRYMS